MKMVKCKKCGKVYSKNLSNCPECFEKNAKYISKGRKTVGIIAAIIGFIMIFFAAVSWDDTAVSDYNGSGQSSLTQPEENKNQNLYETKKDLITFEGVKAEFVKLYDPKAGVTALAVALNLENNGTEEITISLSDGYVNDTKVQFMSGLPVTIAPGKKAVGVFMFGYDGLGFSKVEDIEKMEFKIGLLNSEWSALKTSEKVTLNFK